MVTLSLFAMCGLMGLAIDLGWSFYVHKTARAAADTAALSAVKQPIAGLGSIPTPPYTCGTTGITCQTTLIDCNSASGNLLTGCQYAQQNDFWPGGHGGHQKLQIQADVGAPGCDTASPPNCVPSAPGVAAFYWVRVVAVETIPQLFSAMLGNLNAVVSAESTAGLVNEVAVGGLILLDRAGDVPSGVGFPQDLSSNGGGPISVPGGIVLSSTCHGQSGSPCNGVYAGDLQGNTAVSAPFTNVRGAGTTHLQGSATWTAAPQGGFPDSGMFSDPESSNNKGQPPMNAGQASKPYIKVPGGNLTTAVCNGPCGSGNYYAVDANGKATGHYITIDDGVNFSGGNFGEFVFFGGVTIGQATVNFGPGRYIFAGVQSNDNSCPECVFNATNKATITGGTGSDAGRIVVLTNSTYDGNSTMAAVVQGVNSDCACVLPTMGFGKSAFQSGNNGAYIELHGLKANDGNVPPNLDEFKGIVIWQDQQNSYVKYDSGGNVMTTGGGAGTCDGAGNLDSPCKQTPVVADSPEMQLWAGQNNIYSGIVYQPRGSWMVIHSGSGTTGPLRIITGALNLQGSPGLSLTGNSNPITKTVAALIH